MGFFGIDSSTSSSLNLPIFASKTTVPGKIIESSSVEGITCAWVTALFYDTVFDSICVDDCTIDCIKEDREVLGTSSDPSEPAFSVGFDWFGELSKRFYKHKIKH